MPNSIRLKFASVIPGLWPTDMRQRFGITLGAKTDRAEMKTTKPRTMRLPRRHDVLILASRVEFRLLVGLTTDAQPRAALAVVAVSPDEPAPLDGCSGPLGRNISPCSSMTLQFWRHS